MKKLSITLFAFLFFTFLLSGVKAQDKPPADSGDKSQTEQTTPADSPLVVKRKPHPNTGFCDQSDGLTRLRVTFDKSGKITDAEVVASSGCDSFDQQAIKAAKKIKFQPAIKGGEPITITKLVEYTFRRF